MVHIEDVLLWSLAQDGDRYVFAAEVPLDAADSDEWDCSELTEWSCGKAGVVPRLPDGAYYQWRHTRNHGLAIPVQEGIATRGALLFVGDGTGIGRNAITHVAWSLGNGLTIEARGSRWGVGSWPTSGRFDFAGLVPGVDYTPRPTEEDPEMLSPDEVRLLQRVDNAIHDPNHGVLARLDRIETRAKETARNVRRVGYEISAEGIEGTVAEYPQPGPHSHPVTPGPNSHGVR